MTPLAPREAAAVLQRVAGAGAADRAGYVPAT
jgi:hypothetical protein